MTQFHTILFWISSKLWSLSLSEPSRASLLRSHKQLLIEKLQTWKICGCGICGCIRLRAILLHVYWKDDERCHNWRSIINTICFDFSIFSLKLNWHMVLFRCGPRFYTILSTGCDKWIWTFNVFFGFMGFKCTSNLLIYSSPQPCLHIQYLLRSTQWPIQTDKNVYRTTQTKPFCLTNQTINSL